MPWRHYRAEGRRWPLYWFAIHAALYCGTLLALVFALLDQEPWFVGLSIATTILIATSAWRSRDPRIGTGWRIALVLVMALWWAYMLLIAYWPDGDTHLCYDRLRQTAFRGPTSNLGPDPSCVGMAASGID